jgi:hypothetical protein
MAKHNRTIVFRGGPLDGKSVHKGKTGRWPTYLAEDGETVIKPSEGDRARRPTYRGRQPRDMYVHEYQEDRSVRPVMIHHTYVHTSLTDPR